MEVSDLAGWKMDTDKKLELETSSSGEDDSSFRR